MTSGRDEYLERTKKHIDYEKENELRVWWLNKSGGSAHDGLTVRDYFAAKVMQSALRSIGAGVEFEGDAMAKFAYSMADDMMKERAK